MPDIFVSNLGCNFLVLKELLRNKIFAPSCYGKALFHISSSNVQGEGDKLKTADRNKSNEVEID